MGSGEAGVVLLAHRDALLITRIIDPQHQFLVWPITEVGGDVEMERRVSAAVLAGETSVDENLRLPVHPLEVQQDALAVVPPCRWYRDGTPIVGLAGVELAPNARQGGLPGERHENGLGEGPIEWQGGGGVAFLEFPNAVQVQPLLANELWAWVFAQHVPGIDVRGPRGHEGSGLGLPGCSEAGA